MDRDRSVEIHDSWILTPLPIWHLYHNAAGHILVSTSWFVKKTWSDTYDLQPYETLSRVWSPFTAGWAFKNRAPRDGWLRTPSWRCVMPRRHPTLKNNQTGVTGVTGGGGVKIIIFWRFNKLEPFLWSWVEWLLTLVIDGIVDRSTAATSCLSTLFPMHGTCGGTVVEIVGITSFIPNLRLVEMIGLVGLPHLHHLVGFFNHIMHLQFSGFDVSRGFRAGSRLSRKPYGEYLKQNSVELKVRQWAISIATGIE